MVAQQLVPSIAADYKFQRTTTTNIPKLDCIIHHHTSISERPWARKLEY